jgi:hypothetical protein
MQHYGPSQAYHDEHFTPHPSSFHKSNGQPYYHPCGGSRGRSDPHNLGFFTVVLLHDGGRNKPMLPVKIVQALPHAIQTTGQRKSPEETHVFLDGLANTGAQATTYNLSVRMVYFQVYPHHVKESIDSGNRNFGGSHLWVV